MPREPEAPSAIAAHAIRRLAQRAAAAGFSRGKLYRAALQGVERADAALAAGKVVRHPDQYRYRAASNAAVRLLQKVEGRTRERNDPGLYSEIRKQDGVWQSRLLSPPGPRIRLAFPGIPRYSMT